MAGTTVAPLQINRGGRRGRGVLWVQTNQLLRPPRTPRLILKCALGGEGAADLEDVADQGVPDGKGERVGSVGERPVRVLVHLAEERVDAHRRSGAGQRRGERAIAPGGV